MLLSLPNVTLYCNDTVQPERQMKSLRWLCRFVDFAEVIFATNTKLFKPDSWVHTVHVDRGPRLQYEIEALIHAGKLAKTTHVLHVEADTAIANVMAWRSEWLDYDFIGAPWPRLYHNGWPACDRHNNVGNTGFSLRSVRLYGLVQKAVTTLQDDAGMLSHDQWLCRTLRPWLEREGLRFAPPELAYRFSCENQLYSGQFGVHGLNTFIINGWPMPWDWK